MVQWSGMAKHDLPYETIDEGFTNHITVIMYQIVEISSTETHWSTWNTATNHKCTFCGSRTSLRHDHKDLKFNWPRRTFITQSSTHLRIHVHIKTDALCLHTKCILCYWYAFIVCGRQCTLRICLKFESYFLCLFVREREKEGGRERERVRESERDSELWSPVHCHQLHCTWEEQVFWLLTSLLHTLCYHTSLYTTYIVLMHSIMPIITCTYMDAWLIVCHHMCIYCRGKDFWAIRGMERTMSKPRSSSMNCRSSLLLKHSSTYVSHIHTPRPKLSPFPAFQAEKQHWGRTRPRHYYYRTCLYWKLDVIV